MRLIPVSILAIACGLAAGIPLERDTSACTLAPEVARTNYAANPPITQDIVAGQSGLPLTLRITLMDITTCQPLRNAMVEVWSSNAVGQYGSFLRGATMSNANGLAQFQTIFPGFASDAANHINVAIHQTSAMSSPAIHTGQLFFTDRWTDVVAMTTPYKTNTNHRMLNSQDSNYATANTGYNAILNILPILDDWPSGVTGDIVIGVDPASPKSG